MKRYSTVHPDKGAIDYRDNKRYLWCLSVFLPLFPLFGIYLYFLTASQWSLLAPLAFAYVVIPVLDRILGSDNDNPPEEIISQLEEDLYYRVLTWLAVPLHFITLTGMAWFAATQATTPAVFVLVALTTGLYSGLAINTAHELGHKKSHLERILARIALAVPAYGHFCVEHNRGHHRWVATPGDPASARMGESLYRFGMREIPGAFRRGWAAEAARLESLGVSRWSPHNEILQSHAISLLVQGGLLVALGWKMIPFLVIHNVFAWFQLTCANYVEHYGLLRAIRPDGSYERCKPHHSWNANYIFSNVVLFHLERHSDHHANASRRYQCLRNYGDIPELPSGYFGTYLLAYVPWLWFRVMDRRLLDLPHIRGDLGRINIDPARRAGIQARFG